ncbi:MAG: hypothetical protein KF743_14180, partial [Fimbriimonadaceae bacterium]|nr:hypothetical protein [Fimbriimonadaceae bacterium]
RVLHFGLGRWTRRDPLDVVTNLNLAYIASSPLRGTDPSGLLSNWEFVLHYFFGRGAPYNFSQEEVRRYRQHPTVRQAERLIGESVKVIARDAANELYDGLDCECETLTWQDYKRVTFRVPSQHITAGDFVVHWDPRTPWFWTDYTFSLGNHFIQAEATCDLYAWCANHVPGEASEYANVQYSCSVHYFVRDWFSDPLDFGEMLRAALARLLGFEAPPPFGDWEFPGARPFRINIDWSTHVHDMWRRTSDELSCMAGW